MSDLAKATLTALDARNRPLGGEQPVAVQFNPASLRLQLSNRSSSGGAQAAGPTRQQAGESSQSLSFELVFDSADEGSTESPVSVLKRTAALERFVKPRGRAPGEEAPPRVQFEWNALKVQGVMETLSVDLDLFAADGTPLRARCSVQIKGQDPSYALSRQGAGAGQSAALGALGKAMAGVADAMQRARAAAVADALGQVAGDVAETAERLARSLGGESLAQFAQRQGQDPKDWRQLAPAGSNPQSLPAGQTLGVPSSTATPRQSAAGSAPLPVDSGQAINTGNADIEPGQGNAMRRRLPSPSQLTQQGGLGALQASQQRRDHQAAAGQKLAGFGLAAAAAPAPTAPPHALPPDRPFGFGLPLKPRRAVAEAAAAQPGSTRRIACRSGCGCGCGGR